MVFYTYTNTSNLDVMLTGLPSCTKCVRSQVWFIVTAPSLCYREEWAWLQSHVFTTVSGSVQNLLGGDDENLMESSGLVEFVRSLRAAVTYLLTKLNIPLYRVKSASHSVIALYILLLCIIRKEFILTMLSLYVFISIIAMHGRSDMK